MCNTLYFKAQRTSLPATNLSEVYISLPIYEDEAVLDKRKSTQGHYEFLVKPKGMSTWCATWKQPKDITNPDLVKEYEEGRLTQVKFKNHFATWYPRREDLVVQWKNSPFFIVSYGAGQFNKFCIVGLDKTKKRLKCKNTHQSNMAHHQAHVGMVEKEMQKLGMAIRHKTIMATSVPSPPATIPVDTTKPVSKPISQQVIHLKTSDYFHNVRLTMHQNHDKIPAAFSPTSVPDHCKCETVQENPDGTTQTVYATQYKLASEPTNKPTTLWLPYGPSITNRKAYVWRCQNHNPACNVYYDGHDDAIFNYSNSTMVSHAVLFEFLFGLVTG